MTVNHAVKLSLGFTCTVALGCGSSTESLVRQLGDSDPQIRRAAARALAHSRGDADVAVAGLTRAIQDADLEVQELAISALGQWGPDARASLPALEQALGDPQLSVRLSAALAIQKIDPYSRSYIPVLIDLLRLGHGTVFIEVGQMGTDAQWAVATLTQLLSHPEAKTRALAARTLGQIGVADSEAETSLRQRLRDSHPAVRRAAQAALQQIRPTPATEITTPQE